MTTVKELTYNEKLSNQYSKLMIDFAKVRIRYQGDEITKSQYEEQCKLLLTESYLQFEGVTFNHRGN